MGRCRSHPWATGPHARQQQIGLAVEQGQHLALQAPFAERHAGQVPGINRTRLRHLFSRQSQLVRRSDHPDLFPPHPYVACEVDLGAAKAG